jgi:ERCC4-type nuclease
VRVPGRRAAGLEELTILVDTRERYPYRFSRQQATNQRQALPAGDYGVERDGQVLAVVERKAVADFTRSLSDGSLAFELAHLATMDRAAVVVEGRYGALLKQEHVQPGWLLDLVARLQVRYPAVPIVFADSRLLAEEWTFRFLGAARAELAGPEA